MLRVLGWLFGLGAFLGLIAIGAVAVYVVQLASDLPDYRVLRDYEPPVTTRVVAADGTFLTEYATQPRLFQPIGTIPPLVIDAFVSAEDKNFFQHHGISIDGIIRALRDDILQKLDGSDAPLVGASTITQQVAKNFLLTSRQTWERKIKEIILALRIDAAFSKNKILELYLNEIYLGFNSYGVAAAALNYFDKPLSQLTLSEAAYLAGLPKGPNNYNPFRHPQAAIDRRNYVLDRMAEDGYITRAERDAAKLEPLKVVPRKAGNQLYTADYFTEEVRRDLIGMYGADKVYGGGLQVRTTMDPELQATARKALMDGLVAYDQKHGWREPVTHIDPGGDWGVSLAKVDPLRDVPEWKLAVVLGDDPDGVKIGLRPGTDVAGRILPERITGVLSTSASKWVGKPMSSILEPGDVVYVEPVEGEPGRYALRQVPEVEGAIVAMDPATGRVLALVGGFSYDLSEFNRATQALRQPGSSIKPIVYSAALANGYKPTSILLDAPIEIQNADGTVWKPENYENDFLGPTTLRRGLVLSRNVMTVRLAKDIGMPLIAEYAEKFGIYDHLLPVLAMALGAGETTDLKMTAAYATIANGGRKVTPSLIDRVQDRFGKTIYRHDHRLCEGCEAAGWENQPLPEIVDNRPRVLDPMTDYQIISMMEGVVQRGTGTYVRRLNRPVAGKTGTSSDFRDAWFIGFTPQIVCGVYVGYDTPRSLGNGNTGGEIAAPIFTEFMQHALEGVPPTPFRPPPGLTQAWVDPKTGVAAAPGGRAVLEAFKPGTGPNPPYSVIGVGDNGFIPDDGAPPPESQYDDPITMGRGGLF